MIRDDRQRLSLPDSMPKEFGQFRLEDFLPANEGKTPNIDRTEIKGTGSGGSVSVEIEKNADGVPVRLKDQYGNWKSEDGGKTWKTGEPQFRVRRGETSIDSEGNYSFDNTDYGVKSIYHRDGTSTRSMKSSDGGEYSVKRNAEGVPIAFTTPKGSFTGDGKNWTDTATGETIRGSVNLTDFGEFRFKPDSSDGGDQKITQKTSQLETAEKLQKEITEKYGVKFGAPGEKRVETEDGKSHTYIAGMPTADELKVLKDVLDKTNHEDYRGMKVWFVRPDENKADYYGHYGNEGESSEKPHRCGAGCGHTKARDGIDIVMLPKSRQNLRGFDSLEGTFLHELGHHEQGDRYGDKSSWAGGKESTLDTRKISKELGWVWSDKHGESLLRAKDGGLWRYNEDKDRWSHAGGTKPSDGKRSLTNGDMADRALVRPLTKYFPYPYEQHAEAIAAFRLAPGSDADGFDRAGLAKKSPALYDIIKRFDQESIDNKYGKDANGRSRYVRDLTGHIMENTRYMQRVIQRAEDSWRRR